MKAASADHTGGPDFLRLSHQRESHARMRNKTDNPPPATAQAPPASPEPASPAPLVFHPGEWASSLRDEVLQTISRVGGNKLGLAIVNRDLRSGLLEGTLVAPDGSTMTPLSRTDWERRTVDAMHNSAEGVFVRPYEAGHYFVRRAGIAGLTSPAAPAYADGESEPAAPAEEPMPGPAPEPPTTKKNSASSVGTQAGTALL